MANPIKLLARWVLRHELQEFHLTLAQARANSLYWQRQYSIATKQYEEIGFVTKGEQL
jgi:hypothetical protein